MVKKIRLDFTKVEERTGWNTRAMPEGLHAFTIVGVEDKEAQDGTDMWVFALVPVASRYKTRRFPFYCKLQQNQLWKLRDLFVAAGVAVPKKALTLDPTKIIGKEIAAEVEDETGQYEGRSSINGVYGLDILEGNDSVESGDDEDEEYDEEVDEDEVDEEDEEDEDEQDLEALTLPELRKLAKSLGIDTTGVKKADLIEMIEEEQEAEEDDEDEDDLDDEDLEDEDLDDEDFDDEEDEEEEEPAPAPKRRPAAKAPAKAAAPARRVVKRR